MGCVSILEFGARAFERSGTGDIPDSGTDCTKAIQAAIDACFSSGGGTVEVPAGCFLTGGIRLRSNVTLHLLKDACLVGSRNPEDYMGFLQDTLEPLDACDKTDDVWVSVKERKSYDFMKKPGGRWTNGLIRAIDAHDIAIIGEENSVIDGRDCYDERGEEEYRGPHGISLHRCERILLSGYTVRNSANWAHAMFSCRDIKVERVTVLAGHDGIHLTGCDDTDIRDCHFYTGDDCVAGIDNIGLTVEGCEMNTACSAFRLGGTHIRIRRCHMFGPARYLFRGSLSLEEKILGVQTPEENADGAHLPGNKGEGASTEEGSGHRYNMLSAYTYYADFSRKIREQPGDIVMEDCRIACVDRLVHYNFSGNEPWQNNRPLHDIAFRRIQAEDVKMPLTVYGSPEEKVTFVMEDSLVSFAKDAGPDAFCWACNYEKLCLERVTIRNLYQSSVVLAWSEGPVLLEKVDVQSGVASVRRAERPFDCQCI